MKLHRSIIAATAAVLLSIAGAAPMAAAHAAQASHHGNQRLLALGTDVNAAPVVIANGPIHAAGTDVVINDSRDRFVFPEGNLRVWHQPKTSNESFDPTTCLGTFTERGVYKIVGGSGAYANVSGHGTYSVQGYFVGCDQNSPPTVFIFTINAHGPISF
jgi:hypothetical protein